MLVPVETSSKIAASRLASGDPQVTLSHVECLPQVLALDPAGPLVALRVSCLLELLFVAPRGEHNPPYNHFSGAPPIFFVCFVRDHHQAV
jgi:hypothetical protein